MERNLPTPTMRFFRRKACVLMPFFVEELVRTIRQIAPGQCGDRINHLPKSGLRPLDLVKRISERFLRPLPFNCDTRDVPRGFDQCKILLIWGSSLRIGDAESAENLPIFRNERFRPCRAKPMTQSQAPSLIRPERI